MTDDETGLTVAQMLDSICTAAQSTFPATASAKPTVVSLALVGARLGADDDPLDDLVDGGLVGQPAEFGREK